MPGNREHQLTRSCVPQKQDWRYFSLVEITNITPDFYSPFVSIRQVKYVDRCIKYLPCGSSTRAGPFIESSDDTSMSDHNYLLFWKFTKARTPEIKFPTIHSTSDNRVCYYSNGGLLLCSKQCSITCQFNGNISKLIYDDMIIIKDSIK